MNTPTYELFAVRYATRDSTRSAHFLGGDTHDAPMPMDYFVWAARNQDRCILIDTGFTAETAARRRRTYLRAPIEGLAALGIEPRDIDDVIITHMHYDHVGGFSMFPGAQFHVQDEEMSFATGRHMRYSCFNHGYDVDDVCGMVKLVFGSRVIFHRGEAEIAPGITIHHIGGHTMGMQSVRVHTQRGWVVIASDASHYFEHFESQRCFPAVFHVGDTIEGYSTLRRLADSPRHIIPGHDPLVMTRYPAVSDRLTGIAVRLDVAPLTESAHMDSLFPDADELFPTFGGARD